MWKWYHWAPANFHPFKSAAAPPDRSLVIQYWNQVSTRPYSVVTLDNFSFHFQIVMAEQLEAARTSGSFLHDEDLDEFPIRARKWQGCSYQWLVILCFCHWPKWQVAKLRTHLYKLEKGEPCLQYSVQNVWDTFLGLRVNDATSRVIAIYAEKSLFRNPSNITIPW